MVDESVIMVKTKAINLLLLYVFLLTLSCVLYAAPKRVVSLDMCTDWMLVKYADPEQVLALSNYVYQYPVNWIDASWPTHNGTLEQLLALQPDLVLVGEYNAILLRQRLSSLGLSVAILPLPRTLVEVVQYEHQILALLGKSIEKASKMSDPYPEEIKGRRLLLLGENGIGTGRHTFEDDVLHHAGWRNYLIEDGYQGLDLEQLVVDPPDAVLWSAPRSPALANQFAEHPVLKELLSGDRWLSTDYWYWQCPGPWTWELIETMRP